MSPAGRVTRYSPPTIASLVPLLSLRVGQTLSLSSNDSTKSAALLGEAAGAAPDGGAAVLDAGEDDAVEDEAVEEEPLLLHAATAIATTSAAPSRTRVGTLTETSADAGQGTGQARPAAGPYR